MFDVSASLRGKQFVDCKRGRGWGGAIRKSDTFKSGHDRIAGRSRDAFAKISPIRPIRQKKKHSQKFLRSKV